MKLKTLLLPLLILIAGIIHAQSGFDTNYSLVRSGDIIQDKNFYLFTLMGELENIHQLIAQDEELMNHLEQMSEEIKNASESCSTDVFCHTEVFLWKKEKTDDIVMRLGEIYDDQPTMQKMVKDHMRRSGMFQKYAELNDKEMLIKAWEESINGINYIINTYALGSEQRYPNIDSASYDINDRYYHRLINSVTNSVFDEMEGYTLFFQPALSFALLLLDINNRDEAARFEPMAILENRAAFEYIPKINWSDYKYSAILVPGAGPEDPDVDLSSYGKLRDKLAAKRYKEGWAPLIIVSGGYVHPFQTKYCEAYEMKKDLMSRHGIPEHAILIDPHARHTTTNFRNAARLMYRYGIPVDKMAVVTTSLYQSYYISDMNLDKRCERELGYVPYELYNRLSKFDIEFKPKIISLHADPLDPLDP